jgi:hypothetical protein
MTGTKPKSSKKNGWLDVDDGMATDYCNPCISEQGKVKRC